MRGAAMVDAACANLTFVASMLGLDLIEIISSFSSHPQTSSELLQ